MPQNKLQKKLVKFAKKAKNNFKTNSQKKDKNSISEQNNDDLPNELESSTIETALKNTQTVLNEDEGYESANDEIDYDDEFDYYSDDEFDDNLEENEELNQEINQDNYKKNSTASKSEQKNYLTQQDNAEEPIYANLGTGVSMNNNFTQDLNPPREAEPIYNTPEQNNNAAQSGVVEALRVALNKREVSKNDAQFNSNNNFTQDLNPPREAEPIYDTLEQKNYLTQQDNAEEPIYANLGTGVSMNNNFTQDLNPPREAEPIYNTPEQNNNAAQSTTAEALRVALNKREVSKNDAQFNSNNNFTQDLNPPREAEPIYDTAEQKNYLTQQDNAEEPIYANLGTGVSMNNNFTQDLNPPREAEPIYNTPEQNNNAAQSTTAEALRVALNKREVSKNDAQFNSNNNFTQDLNPPREAEPIYDTLEQNNNTPEQNNNAILDKEIIFADPRNQIGLSPNNDAATQKHNNNVAEETAYLTAVDGNIKSERHSDVEPIYGTIDDSNNNLTQDLNPPREVEPIYNTPEQNNNTLEQNNNTLEQNNNTPEQNNNAILDKEIIFADPRNQIGLSPNNDAATQKHNNNVAEETAYLTAVDGNIKSERHSDVEPIYGTIDDSNNNLTQDLNPPREVEPIYNTPEQNNNTLEQNNNTPEQNNNAILDKEIIFADPRNQIGLSPNNDAATQKHNNNVAEETAYLTAVDGNIKSERHSDVEPIYGTIDDSNIKSKINKETITPTPVGTDERNINNELFRIVKTIHGNNIGARKILAQWTNDEKNSSLVQLVNENPSIIKNFDLNKDLYTAQNLEQNFNAIVKTLAINYTLDNPNSGWRISYNEAGEIDISKKANTLSTSVNTENVIKKDIVSNRVLEFDTNAVNLHPAKDSYPAKDLDVIKKDIVSNRVLEFETNAVNSHPAKDLNEVMKKIAINYTLDNPNSGWRISYNEAGEIDISKKANTLSTSINTAEIDVNNELLRVTQSIHGNNPEAKERLDQWINNEKNSALVRLFNENPSVIKNFDLNKDSTSIVNKTQNTAEIDVNNNNPSTTKNFNSNTDLLSNANDINSTGIDLHVEEADTFETPHPSTVSELTPQKTSAQYTQHIKGK